MLWLRGGAGGCPIARGSAVESPPLLDSVQLLLRGKLNLYRQNRKGKPNAALTNLALAKTTTTTSNADEHLHPPQATRATPAYIPIASGT